MMKLVAKTGKGTELDLDQPRLAIGRDPTNTLVLDDESVSGFHAELFVEDNQVELIDLGSTNGTFVDGQPIHGRCMLRAWQKVRFGQVEMEVVDPDRRRPTTTIPSIDDGIATHAQAATSSEHASQTKESDDLVRGRLALISGGDYPQAVELHSVCTVGREEPSDLKLPSDMVSSTHARLEWRDDHFIVTDLDSTNGTRVNGRRIQSARLTPGDRIAFDEIEYVLKRAADDKRGRTKVNPAVRARSGTTVRPAVAIEHASSGSQNKSRSNAPGREDVNRSLEERQVPEPKPEKSSDDSNPTRVQKAAGPPSRAPLVPKKKTEKPNRQINKPSAQSEVVEPAHSPEKPAVSPADTAPVRQDSHSVRSHHQPIVVKQGGNGCVVALLVVILLIVAIPIIAVVFKVGFLMSIIASIRSFIPFLF